MGKIDELHEVVGELIEVTANVEGFSWGNFLLSSVEKCADDETLTKMIADIREGSILKSV